MFLNEYLTTLQNISTICCAHFSKVQEIKWCLDNLYGRYRISIQKYTIVNITWEITVGGTQYFLIIT